MAGRVGHTGTIDIGKVEQVIHCLGIVERFRLDAIHDGKIGMVFRLDKYGEREKQSKSASQHSFVEHSTPGKRPNARISRKSQSLLSCPTLH
jgi:hypothetical protein